MIVECPFDDDNLYHNVLTIHLPVTYMNFDVNFTRSPGFIRFKRRIQRPEALEYLLNLCQICQTDRTSVIEFPDELTVSTCLQLPPELEGGTVKDALTEAGFIELADPPYGRKYRILLFERSNSGLISRWENGRLGGRKKEHETTSAREQSKEITNQ